MRPDEGKQWVRYEIVNELLANQKKEFIADMKERDNRIECKLRCADQPCEKCTNYKFCDDCNYVIIEKWEQRND